MSYYNTAYVMLLYDICCAIVKEAFSIHESYYLKMEITYSCT